MCSKGVKYCKNSEMFWLLVIIKPIRFLVFAAMLCTLLCGYRSCKECHAKYFKPMVLPFLSLALIISKLRGRTWNSLNIYGELLTILQTGLKNPLARSYLRVRTEVGQVDFSSCSSHRASDIFSLNRYMICINFPDQTFQYRTYLCSV